MANLLTIMRAVLILPFAICLLYGGESARWLAFALFLVAGITDYLDGAIARARNEVSAFGTALDPIADKMLTAAALLLLVMDGTISGIHVIAALIILLREIWLSGLREALAGALTLPVTKLAKWKTAFQFIAFTFLLLPIEKALPGGLTLLWLAAALTAWTGLKYTKAALKHFF